MLFKLSCLVHQSLRLNVEQEHVFFYQLQIKQLFTGSRTETYLQFLGPAKRVQQFIQHYTTLMFYEMLHSFGHLVVFCCMKFDCDQTFSL